MIFKCLETLRNEMCGNSYRNERGETVKVVGVVRCGGGYQVHYNYGATYNVVGGFKKFCKRYPYKVEQ